jgi:hypothetical protein
MTPAPVHRLRHSISHLVRGGQSVVRTAGRLGGATHHHEPSGLWARSGALTFISSLFLSAPVGHGLRDLLFSCPLLHVPLEQPS